MYAYDLIKFLNNPTLATSCEALTHWKKLWSWEGLGAGGKGDDRGWDGWMASLTRWTWLWTLGFGDGQGGLACCDSWGHKESDMTERLNWTDDRYMNSMSIILTGNLRHILNDFIITLLVCNWAQGMLGKIEGRSRRGWQRIRWLDDITNLMARTLRRLWDLVMDWEARGTAVHVVAKGQIQLNSWTQLKYIIKLKFRHVVLWPQLPLCSTHPPGILLMIPLHTDICVWAKAWLTSIEQLTLPIC